MPQASPFSIDIPATDILSWLFPRDSQPSTQPVWIDAENPSRSLSPAQLFQWSKRLAIGLERIGCQQDDVVLVYSTNHIFVPVAYMGAAAHGRYIFSGCNPAYGVSEVKYQIENTRAKVFLVDPALLDIALTASRQAKFPKERIFLFNDEPSQVTQGIKDWTSILGTDEEAKTWTWKSMSAKESRTQTVALNYSSGTTGLPKGVAISHQNVIANVHQSLYMRSLENDSPSSYIPQKMPSEERWLGFLPLYHAYGQLWSISAAAKTLTKTYFMRAFEFGAFLKNLEKHKITHIQTAPPVIVQLGKRPETADYNLSSLRNILCGAAPLSAELQNEVAERINPDLKIVQTYGMTELTCSTCWVPGLMKDTSGAIGLAGPNCTLKLVDDDGKEVTEDGQPGEVHVKGPNVCIGYWRNEQATRETFDNDGFLKTGDVAVHRNGWYWIVDRKKELIKVKGFQVAPAELEAALLEHDDIADAAVVGLPPAKSGNGEERPRAYVALQSSSKNITPESIVKWLEGRVAKHKRLTGGVTFIEEVPKSPSGKIQRKVLRDWAKQAIEAEEGVPKAKL